MTRVAGTWLTDAATQRVMSVLTKAHHQAFAVGGCVRNALLDVPVKDVDIATDARPERVLELASASGIKAVPTGIDHGTITLVVGGTGYEVTTFRRDVATDGRRAVVAFSADIAEDARRRDFTMNALYADADGWVQDPLGGLPDLQTRTIRFIDDARMRIREDYLRTLRFFRFHAWYADPDGGFDAEALAAIADTLDGLAQLSRERVGSEVLRLMAAPCVAPAVSVMAQIGVLARLLPGADPRALGPLQEAETALALAPDPLRRLAAVGPSMGFDMRLSRADEKQLQLLQALVTEPAGPEEIAYRHGVKTALSAMALRSALFEQPMAPCDVATLQRAASLECPVRAADLMPRYTGAALGARLRQLEAAWISSGFLMGRDQLLSLPDPG